MNSRSYKMEARAEAADATRRRILDAARTLFFAHWYDEVTLNGIAGAAGVSHQTVLNHFGSKDGVFSALTELLQVEVIERRGEVRPGDTAHALELLLEQYETFGLANVRAAQQEHRVPALHAALERARASHRAWVEHAFAHILPQAGAVRRQKIAALLAATEVAAWKSLRHDYGFSKRDTAAAIGVLVSALEAQS